MKKLGIIGAMEVEIQTLRDSMENLTFTERTGTCFYEGTLRGLPVVLVQCGIGKVNAAICAQILCDCFGVTHIVNTGIAGSLCPELDIGDMVVSTQVLHHDFDCTHFGYQPCQIPGLPQGFPADGMLQELALEAVHSVGGHARAGKIASGDQFVDTQVLKEQIVQKTGALCTEMEGAAIAQTACRNHIPFVILRAISDKADHSAEMDYPTFENMAAKRCAAVVMELAERMS